MRWASSLYQFSSRRVNKLLATCSTSSLWFWLLLVFQKLVFALGALLAGNTPIEVAVHKARVDAMFEAMLVG